MRVTSRRRSLRFLWICSALVAGLAGPVLRAADDIAALWRERVASVVAVEFLIEVETERQTAGSYGVVIDEEGTILLPSGAINLRMPPTMMKDFKVYTPGSDVPRPAVYLGVDWVHGWAYVRVAADRREGLVPVTRFAAPEGTPPLEITEPVWGLGLRGKDEDFAAYFMEATVSLVQQLPLRTAVCVRDVAGPGLPVFRRDGTLAGLAVAPFGSTFTLFSPRSRGEPVMLINREESSVFQLAGEVVPDFVARVPASIFGRPRTWLGVFGLQPMPAEVARFLNLGAASGVVVSEVLETSPAYGQLQERDIIVALDGEPIPRLKPDGAVVNYVERALLRRLPGDVVRVTVLRGPRERKEFSITLGDEPKFATEAARRYYDRLGLGVREFVFGDGVQRRAKLAEHRGVVADIVKPNAAAATAGFRPDDWVLEIDGQEIATFADAVAVFDAIDQAKERTDFVVLVSRGGETQVLRVKLQ